MRDLAAIRALYLEIDNHFEQDREAAILAGDTKRLEQIDAKRRLNDQAYFVLCWGQLEQAITEACRTAIRTHSGKRGNESRAWRLFDPDDRRLSGLSFDEKARLVLPEPGVARSAYARTKSYYDMRNQIAHGTVLSTGIELTKTIDDFYSIQAALDA